MQTFSVIATLTPEGGGDPIVDSSTKAYGQKAGLGDPVTCTQEFADAIPGVGTISGTVTAVTFTAPPNG